jgi:hypothetical protein
MRYIRLRAKTTRSGLPKEAVIHMLNGDGLPLCHGMHTSRRNMKDGDRHTETLEAFPEGARLCKNCAMWGYAA